jgi:transposase-like protein
MIANRRDPALNRPNHKIVDRTKLRDGLIANRPIYVALAVTVEGTREILGLWAGDGGEGAKHWLHVLTEIKNRGVRDVCMVVCDGLKGLPDAIGTVWPQAVTQTCVIHLLRIRVPRGLGQGSPRRSSLSARPRPRRPR